jgi:hypothetical protein
VRRRRRERRLRVEYYCAPASVNIRETTYDPTECHNETRVNPNPLVESIERGAGKPSKVVQSQQKRGVSDRESVRHDSKGVDDEDRRAFGR